MEKSWTKLIPKVKKPTTDKIRPRSLTDMLYQLFMKIQGTKIEMHIKKNNEQNELKMIYNIVWSLVIKKLTLTVTCIDYT